MAYSGGADVINTVTREEHTGGIPTWESIAEALQTAKIVVDAIDDVRFPSIAKSQLPHNRKNCMGEESDIIGCHRCGEECPFKLVEIFNN